MTNEEPNIPITDEDLDAHLEEQEQISLTHRKAIEPLLGHENLALREAGEHIIGIFDHAITHRRTLMRFHKKIISSMSESRKYTQMVQTLIYAGFFSLLWVLSSDIPLSKLAGPAVLMGFSLLVFSLDLVVTSFFMSLNSFGVVWVRRYFANERKLQFKFYIFVYFATVVLGLIAFFWLILIYWDIWGEIP